MRVIAAFLLPFFLLKSLATAEDYNVMIAYGSQKDLGHCDKWADRMDSYIVDKARNYLNGLGNGIEWTYENTPEKGDRRNLREERNLSCNQCNRCRDYGFPYCNAIYWCVGCRRRLTITSERELADLETAQAKMKNGCERILRKAGAGHFPRVGLTQECMEALQVAECIAVVERVA